MFVFLRISYKKLVYDVGRWLMDRYAGFCNNCGCHFEYDYDAPDEVWCAIRPYIRVVWKPRRFEWGKGHVDYLRGSEFLCWNCFLWCCDKAGVKWKADEFVFK